MAQQRLFEAEARNWRGEILISLFKEINQEFESQRLQLQWANQWADQTQRDKTSLYGELELRT